MFNKFFKLIIFNFIILLLLISKSLSKPLPPGSGAGDVPANILILLDKSGSMSARQVFGTPTVYPYKIAVGNTKDGGKMYCIILITVGMTKEMLHMMIN